MAATLLRRQGLIGSVGNIVVFRIEDSAATTGAGKTGIAWNTSSFVAWYSVDGAAPVQITLALGVVGTWSSGGFVAVDGTNMPGTYELGVPNAVYASGGKNATILLWGASGGSPAHVDIDLTAINNQAAQKSY